MDALRKSYIISTLLSYHRPPTQNPYLKIGDVGSDKLINKLKEMLQ